MFVVTNESREVLTEKGGAGGRGVTGDGEWLAEVGWVLSVAGMASIDSPGQSVHSHIPRQNLEKGQAIPEVEL